MEMEHSNPQARSSSAINLPRCWVKMVMDWWPAYKETSQSVQNKKQLRKIILHIFLNNHCSKYVLEKLKLINVQVNNCKRKSTDTKNPEPLCAKFHNLWLLLKLFLNVKTYRFKDRVYILLTLWYLFAELWTFTLRLSYRYIFIESACILGNVIIVIDQNCNVVDPWEITSAL
jgi:hypothetical protein